MVRTNSHRFNTHVKHLSLSASVVIIIITRLLATSRIITQYFNHLLLYNFYHQSTQNRWDIINFPILPSMAWNIRKLIWILIVCSLSICSNNFSAQFIKIISHYKKIGYNINVLQQTACLVVNPITVGNFAFLFNCTPVGRTSDSMMVPT